MGKGGQKNPPRKCPSTSSQGPLNGGVSNGGGFPDLDLSFLFCPFWDFPDFSGIFPICSGRVRGFSRFVPFLFLGLLRAPTRNSPERVRDTIWTFPERSVGNPRVWKPPGLAARQHPPKLTKAGTVNETLMAAWSLHGSTLRQAKNLDVAGLSVH